MRFRALKHGNPLRANADGWRFAWLPKQMDNGTIIWLEWYRRTPRGA